MLHYANNNEAPTIKPDDLATYHTVAAGNVKVKVYGLVPEFSPLGEQLPLVKVQVKVTDRSNPIYREGDILEVSPLWLDKRER
jgi:hypothetical protein